MKPKSKPIPKKKSQARKQSTVPTKVHTYGARPCSEADIRTLSEQVFLAHKYRRVLVGIEIQRKERFRALRREMSPVLNGYEAQIDALENQIKELRRGLKAKSLRGEPEQVERLDNITALKKAKRVIYPQISAEHDRLQKEFFDAGDTHYKAQKELRLAQAAAKAGRTSIGPNSLLRHRAVQELLKEMLDGDWPDAWKKKALDIDDAAHEAAKQARADSGCNSGTYQSIEKAIAQAKRDTRKDLRQKTFDHTGKVSVQLTKDKGMPVRRALSGTDERLQIILQPNGPVRKSKSDRFFPSRSRPRDLHAEERRLRASRRASGELEKPYRQRAIVRLKLSGKKKDAVYVNLDVILHRPLPEDGIIKWADVYVDRVGYQPVYEFQLTLESETFRLAEGPKNGKVLALNFGWRAVADKARRVVTTWDGTRVGEILLDGEQTSGVKQVANLLGYAACHFDTALANAVTWLKSDTIDVERFTPVLNRAMPRHRQGELDTLQKIVGGNGMPRWRAHEKLRRVARALKAECLTEVNATQLWSTWVSERRAARKDLFAEMPELSTWFISKGITDESQLMALYLDWWVHKDEHLINWARNVEKWLRRYRREVYRVHAARWAKEYETIVIEKWDKSVTAETPEAEDDTRTQQEENANANRQAVGISIFTGALKGALGHRLVEEDATNITAEHFGCGGTIATRLTATEQARCSKCHKMYEQDQNAARHLWSRYRERFGDSPPPGVARNGESQGNAAE